MKIYENEVIWLSNINWMYSDHLQPFNFGIACDFIS